MRTRRVLALPLLLLAVAAAPNADAAVGSAGVAALQVALRTHGLYAGAIDGLTGPKTQRAVRRLQRRAHISVDGVAGPKTRRALGRFGRHTLGSRPLRRGLTGWDVAALQFQLAVHGFPSGQFDGIFGPRVDTALRGYQEWAGLGVDGIAGPSTLGALTARPATPPLLLAWPLAQPVVGDPFGPRGDRFHAGIDLVADTGTSVYAGRGGQIAYAGWRAGGWGFLVTIAHGRGERTMYAHLSRIDVRLGVRVARGVRIGAVGATGHATGPHLHFEVRVRGAAVDPLAALP
jgi:murein DD-endopeptidase MepM/ murein hydrolase activator NlpD